MSEVKANYKVLRVMKDKHGRYYLQTKYFGFVWWTIFSTYSQEGIKSFLKFSGLEYNADTGNYE